MALASTEKVILGSIAFGIFWVMAVFPAVPFLPIGRTAGSLLGAMLMVIFAVLTPAEAYAAIDLPILGLLFGTMVVSAYLERADMFKYLGKLLSWKSQGAKDLLCRICLVSAISSAFFTNDTSCVVLTEFVLKIARQKNLPPHPFLLALASSANIGSSATPIGNPQNLVIAIGSRISFGRFLYGVLPAMFVGIVFNVLILLCMYWKVLSVKKDEEAAIPEVVVEEVAVSHRFTPATMSHLVPEDPDSSSMTVIGLPEEAPAVGTDRVLISCAKESINVHNSLRPHECEMQKHSAESFDSAMNSNASKETRNHHALEVKQEAPSIKKVSSINVLAYGKFLSYFHGEEGLMSKKWKRVLWKTSVYFITIGMMVSFLMGLDMSWTALAAALSLMVIDFKDARPSLEKVSYSLLVFFCGMFITVDGFNKTGIPSAFWEFLEPYAQIDHVGGIAILALIILFLSNLASNVPTVLLLGGRVAASAAAISPSSEKKSWLILAWVSTVAGNLSLLGSAANLIVCEQARRAEHDGYNLSFWRHLKFGFPSTLIITAIGLLLIR